ncbi:ABC transporter permease subunit [Streptomyces tendae]|uniref:ABC transporter permease subunit n=1 Tax=Streptomyces tendae TaxID=1932 RepID=UPI0038064857
MSSDTLAKSAVVPGTQGRADLPRIVPQRRPGRWAAAVVMVLGVKAVDPQGPVTVAIIGPTLHEAAQALGPGRWRRWRWIVLPQAVRAIVPRAGNILIGTLKGTSPVRVVAVPDLPYSVQLVHHRARQVVPMLMVPTVRCTVVTSLLGIGQHHVERHCARGTERTR